MDAVTTVLIAKLDGDLRRQILSRRENMLRELRFLEGREDERLHLARKHNWTNERFEVICGLNAFYQLVLGPLASSSRERYGTLGREIPIIYGESLKFDKKRSASINLAHSSFMKSLENIPVDLLTAPHFNDLLFRIVRFLKESDND